MAIAGSSIGAMAGAGIPVERIEEEWGRASLPQAVRTLLPLDGLELGDGVGTVPALGLRGHAHRGFADALRRPGHRLG